MIAVKKQKKPKSPCSKWNIQKATTALPGPVHAATHPESPWVQHLGVAGEVHVEAPILTDTHCNFLQCLVTAVRAEDLGHVRSCPVGDRDGGDLLLPGLQTRGPAQEWDYCPAQETAPCPGGAVPTPEAAMAAQDVAPGLADQHAIHCQHVEAHLQQHILP